MAQSHYGRRALAPLALCLFTLAVAFPAGRQPQPAASTSPVSLDFMAMTADGTPVPDLRVDQVTLKVDGKARDIRSLQFVTLADASAPGAEPAPASLPAPFGTNAFESATPSRTILVIVDTSTIGSNREQPLRQAVAQLLQGMSSRDRVALVTVPQGTVRMDFTSDRTKFNAALGAVVGQPSVEDGTCDTKRVLAELEGTLQDLAGGDGPTTVLFFSGAMRGVTQAQAMQGGRGGSSIGCQVMQDDFTHVGKAAAAARANFYIVPPDPNVVTTGGLLEGLENLAGVTGGKRLAIQTASETALNRIARETSGYYVATFVPEPNEFNGMTHSVDVKSIRSGVSTRTRPDILIAKPGAAMTTPRKTAKEMVREAKVYRELPLRVAGFSSRHAGDDKLTVVALAEPNDPTVSLASVSMGLFDSTGRLVANWSALGADLATYPVQAAMLAPAGLYRLRAAATDTLGRMGTADYEIDAKLVDAGPLKLSSIVIGLSRNGRFIPKLQFGGEASAVVQLEVYGKLDAATATTPTNVGGKRVGGMLELSDTLTGGGFLQAALVLEPVPGEADRFTAKGTIAVGLLPSSDFLARAVIQVEGAPAGTVTRTIRKQVK